MTELPKTIGRYEILREIGAGGMGEVFLARDPTIDRELALKRVLLGRSMVQAAEFKQRLLREARAAGRLIHPHVVTLFDAGESPEGLYLAFEYVEGTDLARRIRAQPPLTLGQVLTLARQVASALDFAHQQGIVHRDIKPSNILIGQRGEAKVADFGLAKLHGESVELTQSGSVVGSPQYMSPEQVRGETLDGRCDLFSLGVVLYEMLTRLRPFGGQTISTLVYEILSKEPVDVAELHPGVSPRLANLVRRMLAKDPAARPVSAGEVERELAQVMAEAAPEILAASAVAVAGGAARAAAPTPPAATPGSATPAAVTPAAPTPAVPMPSAPTPPPSSGVTPHDPTQRLSQPVGTPPVGSPSARPPSTPLPSTGTIPVADRPTIVTPPPAQAHPAPPPSAVPTGAPAMGVSTPAGPPPVGAANPAVSATVMTGPAAPASSSSQRWLGIAAMAVVGFGLLAVLAVAAWFLVPKFLGGAEDGSDTTVASTTGVDPTGSTVGGDRPEGTKGTVPGEGSEGAGATDPTVTDPTVTDPNAGVPSTAGPTTTDPAGTTPGGTATTAVPPPTTAPPVAPPPSATTPPPPVATPPPPAAAPPPAATTAPPPPAAGSAEAKFDQAASRARRTLQGGRFLRFQVDPPDAYVRVWRRGEPRGYVLGQASDYPLGGRNARSAELPEDGEYLLALVAQGYPETVVRLDIDASRGANPLAVQVALGGSRGPTSGLRVARSVGFSGTPADARVLVDGVLQGPASRWPGGMRASGPRNLQLDPGEHVIRIEAPGYQAFEVTVMVRRDVRKKSEIIHYRLER